MQKTSPDILTPQRILGFSQAFLQSRFDSPKETPDFHIELWKHLCEDTKYVAIAAPRGHAKSTAGTHTFVLACVLFKVRRYIILLSDTEGQAVEFLGDIKRELFENENLSVFGIRRIAKDAETDVIIEFDDYSQTRIRARGSEQKLRGRKWRGSRPDLYFCDDLENDETVMNDDRRRKFRKWFYNAVLPGGSDDAWVRVVGTILHMDSLLARLVPLPENEGVKVEPLKVSWENPGDKVWKSVLYRAHPDFEDFSEILWPAKFDETRLRRERQLYIDDGDPDGYAQEYLNRPLSDDRAYFRKQDFIPIPPQTKESEEFYVTVDMAISEGDRAAYTVILVAGLTHTNLLRIRDVRRFRGDSRRIVDELFEVARRYHPQLIGIEKENIARSLGGTLEDQQYSRGVGLPMKLLDPVRDKEMRARAIQYKMRVGEVQFDFDAEWFPTLRQEMLYFPRSTYKDQVDAMAWMGIIIRDMNPVPTPEQLEDDAWEEEYESTYLYAGGDDGKCPFTGYGY